MYTLLWLLNELTKNIQAISSNYILHGSAKLKGSGKVCGKGII